MKKDNKPTSFHSDFIVYFTTIVRGAPVERSGELICLDWRTKKIQNKVPIFPENPTVIDPNPRGNSRGGRGCAILPDGTLVVASYHSLYSFSPDLKSKKQFSHPLLAGIHEITLTERRTLWVSSTAIDAALEFSYDSWELQTQFWPREMPGIQQALGVNPLEIDKQADNRTRYLEEKFFRHPHHLHLNIVREWKGEVYALFHGFGAIANLTQDKIVLLDPALKGAHNLWFYEEDIAVVNNTYRQAVQFYNLKEGRLIREIALTQFPEVRRLVTPLQKAIFWIRGAWNRLGIKYVSNPLPYFVRGMDVAGNYLFVGLSPATVLQIEIESGRLVDLFNYSHDLASCVHGIAVRPARANP